MQPVPNHPYALYAVRQTGPHDMWLQFACRQCGDQTTYRCSRLQLKNYRIMQYAQMHGHGLRPRRPHA